MSYIRSHSNPEGLYIWREADGRVSICRAGVINKIPRHVFEGLLSRWHDTYEDASYRGARLTEKSDDEFKWHLSYGNWTVPAFMVTWSYIAADVVRRSERPRKTKSERKSERRKRTK